GGVRGGVAGISRALVRTTFAGAMRAEAAIVPCEEILRQARPDRRLEAMIAGVVGLLEAMRGRFDEARASGARSIALFEELGKPVDRKSTRLNSSHVAISYAVFCLKKKIRTRWSLE